MMKGELLFLLLIGYLSCATGSTSLAPTPSFSVQASTTTSDSVTSVHSSTVPSPSPTPTPSPHAYKYYNPKNKTVLLFDLEGTVNIQLTYQQKDGTNKTVTATANLALPNSSSVTITGNLTNNNANLTVHITWNEENFVLSFFLNANATKKIWTLNQVNVRFNSTPPIVNATVPKGMISKKGDIYTLDDFQSYKCSSINLSDLKGDNGTSGSVTIDNFQIQAFHFKGNDFGDVRECSHDLPNNIIVPIAVGAALAGLVIIVVIAYIIGRFRNRGKKTDYEVISS